MRISQHLGMDPPSRKQKRRTSVRAFRSTCPPQGSGVEASQTPVSPALVNNWRVTAEEFPKCSPTGLKSGFAMTGAPQCWICGNFMGPSCTRSDFMGSVTKMRPAAKAAKSTHCNNANGKDMGSVRQDYGHCRIVVSRPSGQPPIQSRSWLDGTMAEAAR